MISITKYSERIGELLGYGVNGIAYQHKLYDDRVIMFTQYAPKIIWLQKLGVVLNMPRRGKPTWEYEKSHIIRNHKANTSSLYYMSCQEFTILELPKIKTSIPHEIYNQLRCSNNDTATIINILQNYNLFVEISALEYLLKQNITIYVEPYKENDMVYYDGKPALFDIFMFNHKV